MSIHTSIATPTADSYVSTASADAYFLAKENSDAWDNIESASTGTLSATTRKENLLKQSTRELDRNLRFYERKYYDYPIGNSDYQALQFPRLSNIDDSSDLYIPDEVKYATYEQALWIMVRDGRKTTNEGETIDMPLIGKEAYGFLRMWIQRQIEPSGRYPWRGSDF